MSATGKMTRTTKLLDLLEDAQEVWDEMTEIEREKLIKKDSSMRDSQMAGLVRRWANKSWAEMSGLQQDGVKHLLSL